MHSSSFVLLLALALPLAAQRISESEPNNSSAQAQVVGLGSEVNASLTAGDEDWFQFTTTGNHVKLYSHGSASVDTVFELFDAAGTNLLAVNDDTDEFFSSISINLAAGTYQLRVTGWGPFALESEIDLWFCLLTSVLNNDHDCSMFSLNDLSSCKNSNRSVHWFRSIQGGPIMAHLVACFNAALIPSSSCPSLSSSLLKGT